MFWLSKSNRNLVLFRSVRFSGAIPALLPYQNDDFSGVTKKTSTLCPLKKIIAICKLTCNLFCETQWFKSRTKRRMGNERWQSTQIIRPPLKYPIGFPHLRLDWEKIWTFPVSGSGSWNTPPATLAGPLVFPPSDNKGGGHRAKVT